MNMMNKMFGMKALIFCLTLLLVFTACNTTEEGEPEIPINPFRKTENGPALNVAHRGGRNLAPENTMIAFNKAVQMGVDVLEMDIVMTSDNILVTNHDVTIDRTSDGSGSVYQYTFDELQEYNFGYHFRTADGSYPYRDDPVSIPRLEEIFSNHSDQYMIIELKNPPPRGKLAAELIIEMIKEYDMVDKVCVFSFNSDVMNRFHYYNDVEILTGASILEALDFVTAIADGNDSDVSINSKVFAFPNELEGIPLPLDEDFIIEGAARHNIAMHYWTVNDKEMMKALINKGADGIITDRPDLMQEALSELGF